MTEIVLDTTPWILAINCDKYYLGQSIHPTGMDSFSSLQQYIKIWGVSCRLGAVIFGNNGHFCSIACDHFPGGDVNILYDGIKTHDRHTIFVLFEGSFKKVVGADYDVTTIWYIKQKSCMVTEVGKSVPESDTGQSMLPSEDKPDDGKQNSPLDENWLWTSATLPELWNNGDDMEYGYKIMLCKDHCKPNTTVVPPYTHKWTECKGGLQEILRV
jgi:hypothetical protein